MTLLMQVASPIKIYDYLAAGLPVITPKMGDWGDLISRENCGISLDDDTVDNYLNSLEYDCQ